GDSIRFDRSGIIHSAGKSIVFTRDEQDRITRITDPMGHDQSYTYDANGDLVVHTDATGNATRFFYNPDHGLLRIVDPLGRVVSRNDYDDDGRLVGFTDANGNRVELSHDIIGRRELITDRLGRATVLTYDERGHVLSSTNALGETTARTYDDQGNKL